MTCYIELQGVSTSVERTEFIVIFLYLKLSLFPDLNQSNNTYKEFFMKSKFSC